MYDLLVGHLGSLILSGKGVVFDLVPFIKVKFVCLFRGLVKVICFSLKVFITQVDFSCQNSFNCTVRREFEFHLIISSLRNLIGGHFLDVK